MCVCVCVCVRERDRERESEKEKERESEKEKERESSPSECVWIPLLGTCPPGNLSVVNLAPSRLPIGSNPVGVLVGCKQKRHTVINCQVITVATAH